MRALVQPAYGPPDVLRFEDVPPPPVGDDAVRVRIRAVSLNFGDRMMLLGRPTLLRPFVYGPGRPRKRVVGHDGAGVVEAVGAKVTRFAPGDAVFGEMSSGTCAELAVAAEGRLAIKPDGMGFAQAATLPIAGITALEGLRDAGRVSAGKKVLVNGASGSVGTFAIQVATALGAEVTAVCSGRNAAQARALGAVEVIDYTQQDYTRGDPRFDVVFDLVGNHRLSERRRVLKLDGIYVASFGQGGGALLGPLGRIAQVAIRSIAAPKRLTVFAATPGSSEDLAQLARWVEEGALTPVIEKTVPFDEAIEAFRDLVGGHARGKRVITMP
ncbi:MAG: NAD(P)-dependent alcohol dehydrogenase [Alphaproteobacteria bacterium]|nr:NAD(P)-dependent alcohol dehydrogenase [Alphaproteobacteria bacterium]MCB9791107.1 NAD(P)-dependent alcohol dehydrogenase [Alphaproteobacteria bacterium]